MNNFDFEESKERKPIITDKVDMSLGKYSQHKRC